jgi:thiol-disulfide isomerase/thioredoxin
MNGMLPVVVALLAAVSSPLPPPRPVPSSAPAGSASAAAAARIPVTRFQRQVELDFFAEPGFEARAAILKKARTDFSAKFGADPGIWFFRVLDAELALDEEAGRDERRAKARTILREVLESAEAPSDVKARASGLGVSLAGGAAEDGKETYDQYRQAVETHLRRFPEYDRNEEFCGLLVRAALRRADVPTALERVKVLTRSPIRLLMLAANDKQEQLLKVVELQKKPLQLKFTAADGRKVDLAQMRGRVVLLDFWATWCPECMAAVPDVVATFKKLNPKGFEIVGISLDENKAQMLEVVKEKGMSWPHYFDGKAWENRISSRFLIRDLPTMWLVDRKGMLVDLDPKDDLEVRVEKLLAAPQ